MQKIYKYLLYILPLCLFFSYHPVMGLGANETMNFELSVPLVWLVVFDFVSVVVACRRKMLGEIFRAGGRMKRLWLMLPLWLTITAAVSLNVTRGMLTAGILWLIYLAVAAMVTVAPRVISDFDEFRRTWLKWFFGTSLVACGWCVVQCILDLAGLPQSATLLCDGCVAGTFGFPHPNGWAIEPQFMGNLLLAPVIASAWMLAARREHAKKLLGCLFVFAATLFLTFSRGAIYASIVALGFLTAYEVARNWRKPRRERWRAMVVWPVVALAFVFTLNLQGVMAAVGPTGDTYATGVAKVLNHLSLGVIDVREEDTKDAVESEEAVEAEPAEEPVEEKPAAVFDGYVAESTDVRLKLTGAAIATWQSDAQTVLLGVGLGGAGQALYDAGYTETPKEIVQNEYASLLLETGLVGVALAVMTAALMVRAFIKNPARGLLLTLVVAYGVTLCFFSGLTNALQIYLMPGILYMVWRNRGKNGISA